MDILIIILLITVAIILISSRSKYALHMVQLEGYKPENYKKWIKNNEDRAFSLEKNEDPVKTPLVLLSELLDCIGLIFS